MEAADAMTLLDWKRRIFELYAEVRAETEPAIAWQRWRAERDHLISEHPQSPLTKEALATFTGLSYFDYDPAYRAEVELEPIAHKSYEIATSGQEAMRFDRIGAFRFEMAGRSIELEAYWLTAYGGGLFVPFADATSGKATYGAGRYLLDTVKGSDLGVRDGRAVLDFNFAYNPSCSYDPRWVCPLATPANRLTIPIEAGERSPE
jgi:uncharacterized protein (DUF1684 family)